MNIDSVSNLQKRREDFTSLQTSVQSGNMTDAQSAFAAFLQDVQHSNTTSGQTGGLFAPGTQASTDLTHLGDALRASDRNGAQQALSSLEEDLRSAGSLPATARGTSHRHPLTRDEMTHNGTASANPATLASSASQTLGSKL